MADSSEDLESLGLVARSYTGFFAVRKRIRKIQDITLPFKRGVGLEQFVVFFAGIVALLIGYGLIIAPITSLFGIHLAWQFYLLYFLGPAVALSMRIGKPMAHAKSIPGTVSSWLRDALDDPVHRRGIPTRSGHQPDSQLHYARMWVADDLDTPHVDNGGADLQAWLDTPRVPLPATTASDQAAARTPNRSKVVTIGKVIPPKPAPDQRRAVSTSTQEGSR